MSFPRDAYPYTNFHELNLGYFIVHFREIFSQWADLYDQMLEWKDATTDELTAWKTGVEADLDQREAALRAELEAWKTQTGQDIAGWEDATLAALTAWQTATQAVFEAIRVDAAGSASAAAASAGDAATAKTAAETAQAAAEAAAASIASSAAQIATNTADISDLTARVEYSYDGYVKTSNFVTGWSQGRISPNNGGSGSSDTMCRTGTYNFTKSGIYTFKPLAGYKVILNQYNGEPGTTTFVRAILNNVETASILYIDSAMSYRFGISLVSGENLAYTDVPANALEYVEYGYTDKGLTETEKSADAKTVGDKFNIVNSVISDNLSGELWELEEGYIGNDGNMAPTRPHLEVTSQKIYYPKEITFTLTKTGENNSWYEISRWDVTGAFLGRETHTVTQDSVERSWDFDDTIYFVRFSWKTDQNEVTTAQILYNIANGIVNNNNNVETAKNSIDKTLLKVNSFGSYSVMGKSLAKPIYDHLFVNRTGNNATIPAESIYHVRISKALGFDIIEAHPQITSDGKYFVHHLASGKFGNYFYSTDGVTDISNISANTVTWAWIEENVRYNSNITKYRTRPTTLEEFLWGCKQNELIPLMKFPDNTVKELTKKIMGDCNYIVYEGTRETAGNAVIFRWENYTTLEDIITFCDGIGAPLIYGSSKFSNTFTAEETLAIVTALHERGYWACASYEANDYWRKYNQLGIDICGGTRTLNRLETGNLFNLENIYNTNDFTITNGNVSDNVITLSNGGTITCTNIDNNNRQIAKVDLEVEFDGVLTLTGGLGEFRGNIEFNSNNGNIVISTAVINDKINWVLTATGEVTIKDIKYKVSIC